MLFKECPNCHHKWPDRTTFLSDPMLSLVGYQANFGNLVAGYFLFNHNTTDCGTSLAVEAAAFADMHDGPIFEERMTGTAKCPGYCFKPKSLDPCANKCECAYVRDVLQVVNKWPKTPTKKAS